jgi:small-conductance mechanosensitive channel
MAAPLETTQLTSLAAAFNRWMSENIFQTLGVLQILVIVVTYLPAWFLSRKIEHWSSKEVDATRIHLRIRFDPAHFGQVARYLIWLLGLWFSQTIFSHLEMPTEAFRMAVNFALALLAVRFASFFIKSRFWARFAYSLCLVIVGLRVFDLWQPVVKVLSSMTIDLGALSFSLWGVIRALFVLIVLWAAGSAAGRFFSHWLAGNTHLTYSDRVLIQRVFNAVLTTIVILLSLNAAGIHMAAIAVTGGAIGIAIGVGLQKIGSNLVSGIILLINKPIRQGDVVTVDDAFSGTRYGWIARMDLMYVHLATRDGTEHLIPNETFVTQKIENLSYSDNRVRLRIPFGISYKSDLKKVITLALEAARGTDRVLKAPEPTCNVMEFGDSNVLFEVRIWIEDPRQGIGRVKSNVFLAIWDAFHANGIEIAFPQRDLHFVDSGPMRDVGQKISVSPPVDHTPPERSP